MIYSWFKNFKIWLVESFLDHTKLKIYKPPFLFLHSISACQKLSWFINSYLRYSWFPNSAIWLTINFFDITRLKSFETTFIFLQYILGCRKSCWLTLLLLRYRADLRISKFDWPRTFLTTQNLKFTKHLL